MFTSFITSNEFQTVIAALNTGFVKTVELFFITLVGALPLGLVISFGSMNQMRPFGWLFQALGMIPRNRFTRWLNGFRPISLVCRLLVWVIRGTPLVLQIIILFYVPGMKDLFSWPSGETGRMTAVCVAFILNYACYFSEIYRGGIQGVPTGQQEAGLVLGMTKSQIFFRVTLLQMIKRIVPPMANEIITLVKDTSIARIISLQEVIWAGYAFMKGSHGYSGLWWPLLFTGLYYLVFNGGLTLFFAWVERKLDYFK